MRGSYAKAALLKMSAKIPQGGLAVIRGKLAKAEVRAVPPS